MILSDCRTGEAPRPNNIYGPGARN